MLLTPLDWQHPEHNRFVGKVFQNPLTKKQAETHKIIELTVILPIARSLS
jgi:hypothetical protein